MIRVRGVQKVAWFMGLYFSNHLYFKREYLWEALQGVISIAAQHKPSTVIHFPDHELVIPLDSYFDDMTIHHDELIFSFFTSLVFEEDEHIQEYLLDMGND